MAYSSRTTVAMLSLVAGFAGVTACGHFGIELVPAEGDLEGGPDTGPNDDGSVGGDGGGAVDASPDARDGGGPIVCSGPSCPGVYVAGADGVGSDGNPGTADKPVATIQKGIELAQQKTGSARQIYVAAMPNGGKYSEKISLVEGVSVYGGYACSVLPCTWARDVTGNSPTVTVLSAVDYAGLVIGDSISRATVLDGLLIHGKSGPPDSASGTVAVTFDGGAATLRNCRIDAGAATNGNAGTRRSVGVAILGPASADPRGPLLEKNTVRSGQAAEESIGIRIGVREAAPFNAAVSTTIIGNNIRSAAAAASIGVKVLAGSPAALVEDNAISAAQAIGTATGSWAIVIEKAEVTIHRNRINIEAGTVGASAPSCTADTVFCGGIMSLASSPTITSNIIRGSRANRAAAVLLSGGGLSEKVILNGNTLDPAGAENGQVGISSAIVLTNQAGADVTVGNVRNNILLGGSSFARYGVYELKASTKTAHLAHLDNNVFFNPARGSAVADYAYHLYDGVNEKDYAFDDLASAMPTESENLGVNPLLDSSFNLQNNSPAIDKGTATEAPKQDFHGEARPKGMAIDIGADERK